MTAERESADRRVGANVRLHRERLGMTQAKLARRMDWPQSTVARTEAGQRPVRVAEAEQLAEILRVSVDRLLWAGGEAAEVALADRAIAILAREWTEYGHAHARLLAARCAAERQLEAAQASKHDRVRKIAGEIAAELQARTAEAARQREQEETGDGPDEEA